jgi:hypothetical protein
MQPPTRDWRDPNDPREIIPQHVLGERQGQVTHMCPECGLDVRPLCPVCLGAGEITDDRLARYQAQLLRDANL